MLKRMLRNPSNLYVTEIVQGCRQHDPTMTVAQVLDGLNELHELGYAIPSTWRLTDQAQPPPPLAAVPEPDLADVVSIEKARAAHPLRHPPRASTEGVL